MLNKDLEMHRKKITGSYQETQSVNARTEKALEPKGPRKQTVKKSRRVMRRRTLIRKWIRAHLVMEKQMENK